MINAMTTRRSLTKLERKAHMSIHNTVDVTDKSCRMVSYTKDRFGKKHDVPASAGEKRQYPIPS